MIYQMESFILRILHKLRKRSGFAGEVERQMGINRVQMYLNAARIAFIIY